MTRVSVILSVAKDLYFLPAVQQVQILRSLRLLQDDIALLPDRRATF
jgi:hypothetical protein